MGIADALEYLGGIATDRSDYAQATALWEESLSIRREIGYQTGIADSLAGLGDVAFARGEYAVAKGYYEECLSMRRGFGKRAIAGSLANLGRVASFQGEYPAARAYHKESLSLFQEVDTWGGVFWSLCNLAEMSYLQGAYRTAALLMANAFALRDAKTLFDPQFSPGNYGHFNDDVRRAIGEEAFVAAWEEGCAMTLEQAITYVLGENL
jgi:tetratricopeptide (TPR) repeat protein